MQSNSKEGVAQKVLDCSIEMLTEILNANGVPDSHGMGHCGKVLEHMIKTLDSAKNDQSGNSFQFLEEKCLSLKLGALLHDADDRKYFAEDSQNAKTIIESSLNEIDINNALDDHSKIC